MGGIFVVGPRKFKISPSLPLVSRLEFYLRRQACVFGGKKIFLAVFYTLLCPEKVREAIKTFRKVFIDKAQCNFGKCLC